MKCPKCGNPLRETEFFCSACGSPVGDVPQKQRRDSADKVPMNEGERVTPNIVLGQDGKYRWIYSMSLFKNPTIFILVWKIFFFVILGIFAFMLIVDAIEGNLDTEVFLNMLKFLGYFMLGMTALVVISFLIYAAIMGGKYIVMFTMDENGINHEQVPSQAKKARKIGEAAVIASLLAGNHGGLSAGMAASRTSMYSDFSRVHRIKSCPRRHLIKIRQTISNNQVYAAPEDYDFVLDFITQRVGSMSPKYKR